MRQVAAKIRHTKKLFITSLASLLLGLSIIITPAASAISIGGPSDCDSNAIINCGAHSTGALLNAYQSSAYVRAVYAYFGISQTDMANLQITNVAGHVNKDGKVYVDNRSDPVATNALTAGRQNIAGSNQVNFQGAVFYTRPPSVSFQQASLPAFVSMKNGQFQFAIIASCGNAVKATPTSQSQNSIGQAQVVSKPQPKPTPKPAPMPTPTPAPAPAPAQAQFQAQSQSQSVNVTNNNTNTINKTSTQTVAAQTVPAANTQPSPVVQTETTSTSQPTSLVNTGTTGVVGIFVAASITGAFIFRRFLVHHFTT